MYFALEVYIEKGKFPDSEVFITLSEHFCRQIGEGNRYLQGRGRASGGWADLSGQQHSSFLRRTSGTA